MTNVPISPLIQHASISGQRLLEHPDFPYGHLFHSMHTNIKIASTYILIKSGIYQILKILILWKKVIAAPVFSKQMLSISQATSSEPCFKYWSQRFLSLLMVTHFFFYLTLTKMSVLLKEGKFFDVMFHKRTFLPNGTPP